MYINAIFSRFRDMLICNVQYSEFGLVIYDTPTPYGKVVSWAAYQARCKGTSLRLPLSDKSPRSNFVRIRDL